MSPRRHGVGDVLLRNEVDAPFSARGSFAIVVVGARSGWRHEHECVVLWSESVAANLREGQTLHYTDEQLETWFDPASGDG